MSSFINGNFYALQKFVTLKLTVFIDQPCLLLIYELIDKASTVVQKKRFVAAIKDDLSS